MAEDRDCPDDWTTDAARVLDMTYERRMQDNVEWLDDGFFISQDWINDSGDSPVQLSSRRPLLVHTYLRRANHESYAHDAHPLVALVHLLRTAPIESEVFVSMPYFSDFSVIDYLSHYAKGEDDGGRALQIKIIFGPDPFNLTQLQSFIGNSAARFHAVEGLEIREYGRLHTSSQVGKFMHSKMIVTEVAGMNGSYNYTYGSRFRHGEDGTVFDDAVMIQTYQQIFRAIWESATVVKPTDPSHDTSRKRASSQSSTRTVAPKFGIE